MIVGALVALLLLGGGIALAVVLGGDDDDDGDGGEADSSSPKGVVEAYGTAVLDGDCEGAKKYVGVEDFDCAEVAEETRPESFDVADAEVDGDEAEVPVELVFAESEVREEGGSESVVFVLEKQDGAWRIVNVTSDGTSSESGSEPGTGSSPEADGTESSPADTPTDPACAEILSSYPDSAETPGTEAALLVDKIIAHAQGGGEPSELIDFEPRGDAQVLVEYVETIDDCGASLGPAEEKEDATDTYTYVDVPVLGPNGERTGKLVLRLEKDEAASDWSLVYRVRESGLSADEGQ